MAAFSVPIIVFFSLLCACSGRSKDLTLQRGALGADVVRSVQSKLEDSNIFSTSAQSQVYELFMRELAYVESVDGTEYENNNRDGGIWRFNRTLFELTQQIPNPELFDNICQFFCIDWTTVSYDDLQNPLHSGLAVRIFLFYLQNMNRGLPNGASNKERASFWVNNFGENRQLSQWFLRITQLRGIETCRVDTDVVFVLDSSGSIGFSNYQIVKDYAYNFTEGLFSGDSNSRVGVIPYSSFASVEIGLDFVSENGTEALLEEIRNLPYIAGRTSTGEALHLLLTIPWSESVSVLRIAVVLTDGMSNDANLVLNSTALMVHRLEPPVIVFAIGVGGNYLLEELNVIATSPDLVDELNSFNNELLMQNQLARTYFICFKESQSVTVGEDQSGSVEMGSVTRLSFSGEGSEGVTVRICISQGAIVIYGSYTIPNPNAALHDFSEELSAEDLVMPTSCYTTHATLNNMSRDDICSLCASRSEVKKKRQAGDEMITVYITIEGASETESQFSVNSSLGDAFECASGFTCGGNAVQVRTDGSCSCQCVQGYEGDGLSCTNTNECIEIPGLCGDNAACIDTDDSYTCECNDGYEEDGQNCKSIRSGSVPLAMTYYVTAIGALCAASLELL